MVKFFDGAFDDRFLAKADDVASFASKVVPEGFELRALEECLVTANAFGRTFAFGFVAQIASGGGGSVDFL